MAEQSLESFNKEGILTNLLSAEEHALGTTSGIDTWCTAKHFRYIGYGHHFREYLQLTETKDPALHQKLSKLGTKWRSLIDRGGASATEIKEIRNEFREIIGDETLSQPKSKCGVCSLDRRSSGNTTPESSESSSTESSSPSSNTALFLIGGVVVVGLLIYLLNKQK